MIIMQIVYWFLLSLNILVIYISAENPEPDLIFIIVFGIFLVSSLISILLQQSPFKQTKTDNFIANIEKVINNGQQIIFIAGLGIVDIIIFVLLAPNAVTYMEQELGIPILLYGLFFFSIPGILLRLLVDPPGIKLENLFWAQFHERIFSSSLPNHEKIDPSTYFSTYILNQIQNRRQRTQGRPPQSNININNLKNNENGITLTSYPINGSNDQNDNKIKSSMPQELSESNDISGGHLFRGQSQENKIDPYAQIKDEFLEWFPILKSFTSREPVNLRVELFLEIIVLKAMKDIQIYQYFKNKSFGN